jgi:Zinc carboxypeptidase
VKIAHDIATGRRAAIAALVLLGGVAGCATPAGVPRTSNASGGFEPPIIHAGTPATRAERTGYRETSRHADVIAFLDSLKAMGAPYEFGTIGRTVEGRELPYVIASRPLVRTPEAARATGKPIVYVQGNIHGGEVEGKEALLALLRDLAFTSGPSVLDDIVLMAVPIYNADGNDRMGPQERQRSEQNGPEVIGQRPNAQGLDLNRDYVKAEAPETRASLAMFNAWDPDVFVDLHTTDGSFHGYALTYSPSLTPAAPLGDYTRTLLAELRTRVRAREGYETFDYGNFADAFGREVSTDTVPRGWYTYDHRPRFGTNYYGLRKRISILAEAYSHDPFERRVKSTYAFTKQLLSLVGERGRELTAQTRNARVLIDDARIPTVPLRAALPPTAPAQPVIFEVLARTGDSVRTQPGVPRGLRRTGEFRTRSMPVFDRFVPTLQARQPGAYVFSVADTAVAGRLRRHGIEVMAVSSASVSNVYFDEFVVDSIVRAPRPFQGHNETRLEGRWRQAAEPPAGDTLLMVTARPLAMYLLDPESDDSFTTWNFFDDRLRVGQAHPVLRLSAANASGR